ncbi:hypothetical protein GCM10023116_20630 [Kistimonas scapharcae]|uniref:Uncharacterized protein n=1 Tax=Kistimonas scapharcae TaxID=1036133 RepID=A0ABP8V1N0_9GAMM
MHAAARVVNTPSVQVLLDAGAKVNDVDNNEQTPLHMVGAEPSESQSMAECTALLLEKGANLELKDSSGETPLHRHVCKSVKTTLVLLKYGADTQDHSPFISLLKNARFPHHDDGYSKINASWVLLDADMNIDRTDANFSGRTLRDLLKDQQSEFYVGRWNAEIEDNATIETLKKIKQYLDVRPLPLERLCRRVVRGLLRQYAGGIGKIFLDSTVALNFPKSLLEFIQCQPEKSKMNQEQAQLLAG